ncbi:MAG TPA: nucleic acid/nucleotide deaminase domain-containing protein [Candidatus Babeliaceae bacterium]|nr:nucleic acid/nucleotide deaminase domain-containing protein [Candidatus Babeliaceae bacterium]
MAIRTVRARQRELMSLYQESSEVFLTRAHFRHKITDGRCKSDIRHTKTLDRLARLLIAGNSKLYTDCVAVTYTVENGIRRFYVATNQKKLAVDEAAKRLRRLIQAVINYKNDKGASYIERYAPCNKKTCEVYKRFRKTLQSFCSKNPLNFHAKEVIEVEHIKPKKVHKHERYVHAELALIKHLKISTEVWRKVVEIQGRKLIGISKLCCNPCHYYITHLHKDVRVRGRSGNRFPNWGYPSESFSDSRAVARMLREYGQDLSLNASYSPDTVSSSSRQRG